MAKELRGILQRAAVATVTLALGAGLTVTSLLMPATADAYTAAGGQVQSRAIYMSSSKPFVSGDTAVTYLVTFKPASTASIKGIVLDFCSNDPIIGDSCTAPTSFTIGTPTVSTAGVTSGNSPTGAALTGLPLNGGSWTATSANSGRTLKLDNTSGSGALVTSTPYVFTITTVVNPSTTGSFYARLLTYTADAGGSDFANYAAGTEGAATLQDYGGIALSTVANINITAKVQESLSFCTSGQDISGATVPGNKTCTQASTPSLTLGHGSPTAILDNTAIDMTSAYTQASTNATSGLVIRMHATNTCSGLSSNGGTTCGIAGANNTAAASQTAGASFFGLMVGPSTTTTGVTGSSGTITPDLNYNATGSTAISGTPASNAYGMDNTGATGVNSTYGDIIASSAGPISTINNQLAFAGTAALTVPAGIYTGSESLIATGTF